MISGLAPEKTYASSGKCIEKGCSRSCSRASWYCSRHECKQSGCYHRAVKNGYCSTHAPKAYNSSTTSNKGSSTGSKSYSNSSSSYKKPSSSNKKNYSMPDCDNYEDYDDFMDDWDGCMPDGSDAEDYWDNW